MKKIDTFLTLNKIYLYLVLFLPIGLLISSGVSEITEILIIITFLITCFYTKNFDWLKNKNCYLFILIWLSLLLNLLFSQNFNLSFVRNLTFFKNIIFVFALIYIFKKEKNFNQIFIFCLIISSVVTFDIFFEYFTKRNIIGFESTDPERIASFLGKELKIAHYVLGFSFISIGYYFEKYSKRSINYKIFGYLIVITFFTALLLSGERANTLKGIILISVFIILLNKEILKYKKIFFILILLLPIIVYFSSDKIRNKFAAIHAINKHGLNKYYKETQHGAHFYAAIKIFQNYPIFGVGNKNFREECSKKEYENKEYKWTDQRCSTHPHQIYYEFLAEHGIVGTVTIVFVIFYILSKSLKIYLQKKNSIHLASILFVLVQFLPLIPSGSFFTSWGATIFWFNFSIIIFFNEKV